VQDLVGAMLVDTTTVDFTYNDVLGQISAVVPGAALTKTDDTNVTLTLGGSASTALARAASLTLGWTGQLAVTRGGTGLATVAQGDLLYGSASNALSALAKNTSATRYLSNTGASNNPAWAQVDLTNGVTGVLPAANLPGSFNGFANPSASVGLSAVNGSAATAMRSDGSPALSQSITPEWTGTHGWADNAEIQLGTGNDLRLFHDGTDSTIRNDTGDLKFLMGATEMARIKSGGNFSFSGVLSSAAYSSINGISLAIESSNPVIWYRRSASATDEKNWAMYAQASTFSFYSYDDSGANAKAALQFDRTGNAITVAAFGNSTDNPLIRFRGTGNVRFDGSTTGAQTATFSATNKPGSATAGVIAWIPVLTAGGTQGYVPVFGA